MTKGARVMIKRICDELMKWCEERHVMCEFATTDDEGLSATFMVGGTTLSVSHIELRDADEFSRYVKNVLFGIDESAVIDKLKEEIDKKDEFIVRLQNELVNEDRKSLYGQIGELEEELESKDACISRLEREDKEKAKDIEYLENKVAEKDDKIAELKNEIVSKDDCIAYLQCELNYMEGDAVSRKSLCSRIEEIEKENIGLKYQLDMKRTEIEDKDAYIGRLEREDKEKVKELEDEIKRLKTNGRILYLEECIENRDKTVKKLSEDNVSLSNQLEMKRTKISELEQELKKLRDEKDNCKYWLDIRGSKLAELNEAIEEKEKNLNTAADKIVQLKCANTSLKEQVDILKCSLNNSCENYDLQVTKRMKAEGEIENLKKQLNDIIVTKTKTIDEDITIIENLKRENVSLKKENATLQYRVDALQNDRKDLLSGYKKDLDNLNNEIKRLKQQIM